MARVAGDAGVRAFILVSTDKAVAPATVMGASKALAELAVEAADARFRTRALRGVRFGNVLGSSGSAGADLPPPDRGGLAGYGHRPTMTRYFMTIPEAVQLVVARLARRGRRGVRARWARRSRSSSWRRT